MILTWGSPPVDQKQAGLWLSIAVDNGLTLKSQILKLNQNDSNKGLISDLHQLWLCIRMRDEAVALRLKRNPHLSTDILRKMIVEPILALDSATSIEMCLEKEYLENLGDDEECLGSSTAITQTPSMVQSSSPGTQSGSSCDALSLNGLRDDLNAQHSLSPIYESLNGFKDDWPGIQRATEDIYCATGTNCTGNNTQRVYHGSDGVWSYTMFEDLAGSSWS